jgi:prevent-host-death family protein
VVGVARTIAHRELRNNSSAVLREVQAGETIEVTNNGEVVAVLIPPPRKPGAAPRLHPPKIRGGFTDLPRYRLDHPVQDVLDDIRGER